MQRSPLTDTDVALTSNLRSKEDIAREWIGQIYQRKYLYGKYLYGKIILHYYINMFEKKYDKVQNRHF